MSHFTHIETRFQNLFYLEKALNKLDIDYTRTKKITNVHNSKSHDIDINLQISQSNGYDIEFSWNGQEYELVADTSFWEQRESIPGFISLLMALEADTSKHKQGKVWSKENGEEKKPVVYLNGKGKESNDGYGCFGNINPRKIEVEPNF